MAWNAPRTWVTGETPTAAIFNTHVRDNFNQFDSVTASGIWVSDGSGPVARHPTNSQGNGTQFDFTNTSYLDLDAVTGGTPGSAISVSVATGTKALVMFRAKLTNDTGGGITILAYRVSGASTVSASDIDALFYESSAANDTISVGTFDFATSLTAGTNVFELQARVTAGTGKLQRTELFVLPL